MPVVFVPAMLRDLTAGAAQVRVPGRTIREVIEQLEARFPGTRARLLQGEELRPDLAVAVDGELALDLSDRLGEDSEVHFIPPISGGALPAPETAAFPPPPGPADRRS
ncbi:MAG: hypothetical protein KatS3mg131_0970 [Candidatus Tectimicrobiota bacterium]|nr:MAG: hypothetical protein KatS3mg131_0970 [Candidatus Tectomicrobia bacterium]